MSENGARVMLTGCGGWGEKIAVIGRPRHSQRRPLLRSY